MADRYNDRPFPPEDDYGRDDSAAPKRLAENDPLAELARLIGQTDPFSSFGRDGRAPAPRDDYDETDEAAAYYNEPTGQPANQLSWMRNRGPAQDAQYGDRDPYNATPANDHYDNSGYDDTPRPDQRQGRDDQSRYDEVLFGQPDRNTRGEAPFPASTDRYDDDRYNQTDYDEGLEDEPRSRRGGTMTVVVVLLLAVVGTAAAFGYRTFVGSPRSGEPPVIKADAGPNKIVSSASGDGKIEDRIGDKPSERVVSREEQPVDVNGKAQPRVVFPPLSQNANPPTASSANTAARPTGAGVGNGTLGGEEPRKIRTLSIRPDQPDVTTSTAPPAALSAPSRATPAARAPATATAAAPSGGPVALTPPPQAAAPAAKPRVASIAPSAGGSSGSYVQVSSQKTEGDAEASFKALQSKYSGILGSKPSTIRRADLGEKGIFYRAMVGPFGTTDEATQFCVNLKSAGGQCIVQRN